MNWLDEDFNRSVKAHTVDKAEPIPPRPWTFKHQPVMGAIDNHQIQAADGDFVGEIYSYSAAKWICDLVNATES